MAHDDTFGSLGAEIEALARCTGAPATFVQKIRILFERKGISLGRSAGPYMGALREAFRREENIRRALPEHVRLARRQEPAASDPARWESQLHVRDLRDPGKKQSRRVVHEVRLLRQSSLEALRMEDVVLCPGSVELPIVPGPDDLQ